MHPSHPFLLKWHRVAIAFFLLSAVVSVSVLPAASSSPDPQPAELSPAAYLPVIMFDPEPPRQPTSFELIDKAVEEGQIDAETALEYKVFTVFDDGRLPAGYRAAEVGGEAGLFMNEVVAAYPTLSDAAKAIVEPFFIPPYLPDSWAAQANGGQPLTTSTDWAYITAAGGKARVWYPSANADFQRKAGVIASALNNDIWVKETALMQQHPVYDGAGVQNFVVFQRWRNGWNGSFVPFGNYGGLTVPQKCSETASVIYINPALPDTGTRYLKGLVEVTAHEFMHTLQFAYPLAVDPCSEYRWMGEATATWAEDFIYPDHDTEQMHARSYLQTPHFGFMNREYGRDYGEYLLVYWWTHNFGNDAVRLAWERAGSFDSLNSFMVFGNLFSDQLVALLNTRAFGEYFWKSDVMGHKVRPAVDTTMVATSGLNEYEFWDKLPPGGARYFHYYVDPSVHTITFLNGLTFKLTQGPYVGNAEDFAYSQENVLPDDRRGADVVTAVKFEGVDEPWVLYNPIRWDYCQDFLRQKVTEIVVIIANNDTQDRNRDLTSTGKPSRILASATPCIKVTGSATRTDTGAGTVKETLTASGLEYTYYLYDQLNDRTESFIMSGILMKLRAGTVSWQISGEDEYGCTYSGSQNFTITENNYSALQLLYELLPGSLHFMGYGGASVLDPGALVTKTITCPNRDPQIITYPPGDFFDMDGTIPVNPNGTLTGTNTIERSGTTSKYEWNLQPATLP